MLKEKKCSIILPVKNEDEDSVEGLLFDLEKAIKKRTDDPHNKSTGSNSSEKDKINAEDDDDDEFDEDFVLKEIEFCETEEEMKELLESEESKLIFSHEKAYEFLYKKSLKKSFIMMKIIKKFSDPKKITALSDMKEHCEDLTKKLEAQKKENLYLKKEKNELSSQKQEQINRVNKITKKCDELKSELNLYKGEPKALTNLDYETIACLEKKFQETIKNISEYKTNVNFILFFSLKYMKLYR